MTARRLLATTLLLSVTATAPACAPRTAGARGAMIVAGAALVAGGLAMSHAMTSHDDSGGGGDNLAGALVCIAGGCLLSGAAIASGAVLTLVGLTSPSPEEPPTAPSTTIASPAPTAATAPTLVGGGGYGEPVVVPASILRPLPEVATDELTLRMAKQVRSAVLAGDCKSARVTLAAIDERDARYHLALVQSVVMDGCR
ncbi:MAG: hypothetical protein H6709_12120 [Kofleriaceae bacterium]|nr:hypothetical protein [Myxococcales bacterium]MCB9564774.1 hypothetical protein [Kofleriaceae bacterium]MCB9572823.1 hypothetical protein [Kofleriaceae bacterium]